MLLTINNYSSEYEILLVTRNEIQRDEYLSVGRKVVFINNNHIIMYPQQTFLEFSEIDKEIISNLGDGSILELYGKKAFVYFDSSNSDNAIFITNKCNSSCIMCPVSEKERKNSEIEDINKLLEICSYMPNYQHHLTITGGEPFLLKDNIFILFEYLKQNLNYVDFLLLTNGRAFSNYNYFKKFIETVPNNTIVGIPIHGYNEVTHNQITRTSNSFEQTVIGIKRLLKTDIKIELRIVVSKLNVKNLTKIAEYIISEFKGIYTVKFIGLEMLGSARKYKESVWIDYKESFKYMKNPIKNLILNGFDVGIYNYPLCCVDKGYWSICEKSISDYKIRYLSECDSCLYKDACGGMFQGTYRLMEGIVKAIK